MFLLAASVLALGGALALIAIHFQQIRQAPDERPARKPGKTDIARGMTDYLARAGLNFTAGQTAAALSPLLLAGACAFIFLPAAYALIALLSLLLAAHLTVQALAASLRRKTLAQLPSFLNQVIRRVAAGASVQLAISDSLGSIGLPLRDILERAERRVRLGYELHDSLEREAALTGLPEFRMLATVLRLNEQFGGSIRGVLENVVDILLVQQQGQRELRALTGETRITAVVLASLPVAAAAYMLAINPRFLLNMWHDALGHRLLAGAAVMQSLGVLVLWRMVRSV